MDRLQQLVKDLTDSWGVPWAMGGMKRQNRDAGGQLLKGEQGIPLEFVGMAEVVSWDMKCCATAFSVPTRARRVSNPHEYWGLDG